MGKSWASQGMNLTKREAEGKLWEGDGLRSGPGVPIVSFLSLIPKPHHVIVFSQLLMVCGKRCKWLMVFTFVQFVQFDWYGLGKRKSNICNSREFANMAHLQHYILRTCFVLLMF